MALRVARGLFRLWLVLSVLWVGGVGVMTWRTFPVDDWVGNPPPPGFVLDPTPDDPAPAFDPSRPYQVVLDKERGAAIKFAVVLALVPPALVLAFGSALVWAFRGFR